VSQTRPRFIPEICAIGVVGIIGAVLWSTTFGPRVPTEVETPAPVESESPPAAHDTWKPATKFQKAQASKSITAQLDAFKKDDYTTAVKYQSSNLRRNFASVAQFRQMMNRAYPQFAHYKSVEYGSAVASPDGLYVNLAVRLTGNDGVKVRAVYVMRRENGLYRVDSVAGGEWVASPGIST
jgi:hypothetical protein